MKFYFHPRAEEEFNAAVEYYEGCRKGLGLEFTEEAYAAIARISEFPDAWTTLSENTRRAIVNRFPYGIVYQMKSGALRVIAVANLHRHPDYWRERA